MQIECFLKYEKVVFKPSHLTHPNSMLLPTANYYHPNAIRDRSVTF